MSAVLITLIYGPVWALLHRSPFAEAVWLVLLAVVVLTWLSAIFSLRELRDWIHSSVPWLLPALAASTLTLVCWSVCDWIWLAWLAPALMRATYGGTWLLLSPICPDLITYPNVLALGTPGFQAQVTEECAGYRGLGVVTIVLLTYFWIRRGLLWFPTSLCLLPFGWIGILLANCLRIACLIVLGSSVSSELAANAFHAQIGWIMISAVCVTLIYMGETLPLLQRNGRGGQSPTIAEGQFTVGSLVLPFAILLFSSMCSMAFSLHYDLFYPLRVLAVGIVLWSQRRAYAGLFRPPSRLPIGTGVAVYAAWTALSHATPHGLDTPWTALPATLVPCWIVFRILGAGLVIPLTEELVFRGYLLRALQAREFTQVPLGRWTPFSLVVSSLAFGWLHEQFLAGFVAGLAYAWVVRRRGSLGDAVLAHAVTNLCLVVQVLVLKQWWLWA